MSVDASTLPGFKVRLRDSLQPSSMVDSPSTVSVTVCLVSEPQLTSAALNAPKVLLGLTYRVGNHALLWYTTPLIRLQEEAQRS